MKHTRTFLLKPRLRRVLNKLLTTKLQVRNKEKKHINKTCTQSRKTLTVYFIKEKNKVRMYFRILTYVCLFITLLRLNKVMI